MLRNDTPVLAFGFFLSIPNFVQNNFLFSSCVESGEHVVYAQVPLSILVIVVTTALMFNIITS